MKIYVSRFSGLNFQMEVFCTIIVNERISNWIVQAFLWADLVLNDNHNIQVILQSMHKYMPIIQVHRIFKPQQFYSSDGTSVRPYGHSYIASSLKDPNTEFIAVTAYQVRWLIMAFLWSTRDE